MTDTPELDDFTSELRKLKIHRIFKPLLRRGNMQLRKLALTDVAALMLEGAARYFLLAAANLNRTQLKKATSDPEAVLVEKKLRQAYAVKEKLPLTASFDEIVTRAESLRKADLGRRQRGRIEALFRERLAAEKIPILMAPPRRVVPGIVVPQRVPDGVWPDPSTKLPPMVYLEIKNVRRVADDIQKRLYEIAEASLEMKLLYGNLNLKGLGLTSTAVVLEQRDQVRAKLRKQIVGARPTVVALLLCPRNEAERYRAGAETFIDRLFFQEEIEACLEFLRSVAKAPTSRPRSAR